LLIQININKGLASSAVGEFLKGPGSFLIEIEITIIQIVILPQAEAPTTMS